RTPRPSGAAWATLRPATWTSASRPIWRPTECRRGTWCRRCTEHAGRKPAPKRQKGPCGPFCVSPGEHSVVARLVYRFQHVLRQGKGRLVDVGVVVAGDDAAAGVAL